MSDGSPSGEPLRQARTQLLRQQGGGVTERVETWSATSLER